MGKESLAEKYRAQHTIGQKVSGKRTARCHCAVVEGIRIDAHDIVPADMVPTDMVPTDMRNRDDERGETEQEKKNEAGDGATESRHNEIGFG